ncbi:MAG: S41 family peptidase [Pseudomonadota bacterium]
MIRQLTICLTATGLTILSGCGGGGGGDTLVTPVANSCSAQGQVDFMFNLMNDIYFWIDEVPPVANVGFTTPEAVLEAFRFQPLDTFSGLRDRAANDAFFSNSQFIGFGFGTSVTDDNQLRLTQVFGDGAAAAAGLARGDTITAIDGRAVSEILAADELGSAFGPSEEGVAATLDYIDAMGNNLTVQLTKGVVTIETVSRVNTFDVAGRTVGYLSFRTFVEPAFAALDTAIADLAAAGVQSLVLDLRYNGGGLIDVAEQLASQVGGAATVGQIFARRLHNAANSDLNVTTRFNNETTALSVTDVVVITTGATASASELVINALRPFVPVTVVGSNSFGKPVGSYQYEFCDKVAVPTAFESVNANNDGRFFDGFVPDCPAADDLDNPLGDAAEASLAEALFVIENGACSANSRRVARSASARATVDGQRRALRALSDWQQTLVAF